MASVQLSWSVTFLLLLTALPGVCCDNYNLGGLVASGGIAFIFLIVVIVMLAVGLTWKSWYPQIQYAKGRVKMPREYWKKKEEVKLKLLNQNSRSQRTSLAPPSETGLPNGNAPSRVQDTEDERSEGASWVQGWNNANPPDDQGYEEMALAMDLGEEKEEPEFRIETTVVDNETLDLGPFRDENFTTSASTGPAVAVMSQQTASMEMPEERDDYLYSSVDLSKKTSVRGTGGEQVTSFSQLDPSMVAL